MRKLFYPRLAFTNLRKNSQTYTPFILTVILSVILFYNLNALSYHSRTLESQNLFIFMNIGIVVATIFISIFLFYTNSFLIKRRKKEFGLFNILGMEKKHIGKVMLWETFYVSSFSILCGLLFGIILSKLFVLLLHKILHFDPQYNFEINKMAIGITILIFIGIFILILLNNLGQIHLSKPVELLKGGNVGEKEPKTKWIIAIIGFLTLGTGYYLALTLKQPLMAFPIFLLAVILVIIGTYCLFTAGSIAILKMLRKKKSFYYKAKHFTSISGMLYRMKQNAVGLANICILSTAVLVTISTTISLYIGMDGIVSEQQPTDITIFHRYNDSNKNSPAEIEHQVQQYISDKNINISDYSAYRYISFSSSIKSNRFSVDTQSQAHMSEEKLKSLTIIPQKDYEKLTNHSLSLKENEAFIYSPNQNFDDKIIICDIPYSVAGKLDKEPFHANIAAIVDSIFIVVPDMEIIEKQLINQKFSSLIRFNINFNLNETFDEKLVITQELRDLYLNRSVSVSSQQEVKEVAYELYGSFLFLGIFLGGLFLMATVLIIYYKQVVEGFEDKERFTIMQKVGMSSNEVKKSIRSQVLTVFVLPIAIAVIHIIAAFPIMTKLLNMLYLDNTILFAICTACTILVFILIYVIVYMLTAKVYYKIVNQK